jgi:membrane-associated phospholipid phosphatase
MKLRPLRAAMLVPAMLACSLAAAPPAQAGDKAWRDVADAGVIAVLAGAVADTAAHRDASGAGQLALSLGVNEAATWGLKHTIHEARPDHRDRRSFPSGHTSRAFAAATYLEARYGWPAGAPALAVASLVGVARVQSHDHHAHDVLAGAALGAGAAVIFTRRLNDKVRLTPWSAAGGGGLTLAGRF